MYNQASRCLLSFILKITQLFLNKVTKGWISDDEVNMLFFFFMQKITDFRSCVYSVEIFNFGCQAVRKML